MQEEIATPLRQPRFHIGMRVRVVSMTQFRAGRGTIRSVSVSENTAGIFETYSYRVVMDDLLIADLPEEAIESE